jgi:AMP phosphorylase
LSDESSGSGYDFFPVRFNPGFDAVVLAPATASSLGAVPGSRIAVGCRGSFYGAVVVVDESVKPGSVGLTRGLYERLSSCKTVELYPFELPQSFPVLRKRLEGKPLEEAEFKKLIGDIVNGFYDEAQIAGFLVSQLYKRLSEEELSYLIRAMVETGVVVKFPETVYDVHSIGGVPGNSKVALLTVPIVASLSLLIPKTSSRAITSPAGTADTMEVLARVTFTPQEVHDIALRVRGAIVWGGALGMAPADDIFVRVERRLDIDPETQMVASILSKKLAMSVSRLVVDIPVGRGAKVENEDQAVALGSIFLSQAQRLGLVMRVALTYGGEPIGYSVGPALEAREALETLIRGEGAPSYVEKACSLAGLIIELGGAAPRDRGYGKACEMLRSGAAYKKFREIIEAQEGDPDVKPEDIKLASRSFTLEAPRDGVISFMSNKGISLAAKAAGAPDDKGAGILLHAKTGHRVRRGDPLLTVYASTESRLRDALRILEETNAVVVEGVVVKVLP